MRGAAGWMLVASLGVVAACLQPIDPVTPEDDAGEDAGSDAGEDGGADASTDAGERDAGPALGWTADLTVNGEHFNAVHGGTASRAYLAGGTTAGAGVLRTWNGSEWTGITYALVVTGELFGVHAYPGGAAFAAGDGELLSCTANCSNSVYNGAWTRDSATGELHAVCGDENGVVYAVGSDPDSPVRAGVLYEYSGGSWSGPRALTGLNEVVACFARRSGELYVAGAGKLGRYDGGFTVLTPSYPGGVTAATEQFHALWGTDLPDGGFSLYATANSQRIYETNGVSAPVVVFAGDGGTPFRALYGSGPTEAYAFGAAGGGGARFTPVTGWVRIPEAPAFEVRGLWSFGPDGYLAVGAAPETGFYSESGRTATSARP